MPAEKPGSMFGGAESLDARRRARRILATLLVGCWGCWFAAPSVLAQGLSLGSVSPDRPIEVSADSGLEWHQDAQLYIARGNAVAKRGATEVHADTLTAHYRKGEEPDGESEIYRLDAEGHIAIKGERMTIVGDRAVYDVDQQIGVVTGNGLRLTTAQDVVTAKDSLEWYDAKQIAVARGDAVVVRDTKRLRADVLTAHMTKEKPRPGQGKPETAPATGPAIADAAKPAASGGPLGGSGEGSRISRVDAQGNVLVSTTSDIARGDYGVYNADTGIVTLLGNVTVTRGPNAIRGQYAVVDLNNNISRMMAAPPGAGTAPARVEGLFVRQEKGTPPAAGAAGAGSAFEGKPKP